MRNFNAQSDVSLYVANFWYPLSLGMSLLLLILMVGLAVLPLNFPNTQFARALVLINIGLLPTEYSYAIHSWLMPYLKR